MGQEEVQAAVYRLVSNFAREGRTNRLILLHGPNGSAKSTFVACMQRAMEHYSTLDEGALYRFNWIFPSQKLTKGGIGFGGGARADGGGAGDLRLPRRRADRGEDRRRAARPPALAAAARQAARADRRSGWAPPIATGFRPADYLLRGDLSHRNRQIFEALLSSYHGDLAQGAAPRAGRALLRLAPLPAGGGDRRAAAGGRRALAAADDGPLAGVAAAGAAVADAVRVPGRAGRREPRRDRLRRSAQAAARGVQVPARHGGAGAGVAGRRQPGARHGLHRLVERGLPGGVQGDPRVPVVQGADGAGARAVPARLPRRAEDLRGADQGRARRVGQARRAARRLGGGAVGGADADEEAAAPRSTARRCPTWSCKLGPLEKALLYADSVTPEGLSHRAAARAGGRRREDRARVGQLPELRGAHRRVAARDEAGDHERGAEPALRVPVAVRGVRRAGGAGARRDRLRVPEAGAAAGRLPREPQVHLPGARPADRPDRRRGADVDGAGRGAALHRAVRALRRARLVLGQEREGAEPDHRAATRIPTRT